MEKVLIADGANEWRSALAEALSRDYLVSCCSSGDQVLAMAAKTHPDVLILDMMLPGADGLSVLQAMSETSRPPCIIVTSSYFSTYVLSALDRFQVDYAAMKPCTVRSITERVADLLAQRRPSRIQVLDPYDQITAVLIGLSAPSSQSGFHYLRDGILLLGQDPHQQLTKSLYPAIAKLHGTNAIAVEKAIRTTVSTAWKRRNEAVWRQFFLIAPNGQIPKPTSGQFMRRVLDAMAYANRKHA